MTAVSEARSGRCGNRAPRIVDGPSVHCALAADHRGWHRGDDGSEWGRLPAAQSAVDVDALEAARAAASKAPWHLVGGTHDREIIDDHGCHTATTGTIPDAALIVAAVNALPALLAAVRERDALRAAVSGARERLAAHRLTTPRQCLCGERQDGDWSDDWHADHLLPVVQALVAEGQAEALERIADERTWTTEHDNEVVSARDLYEEIARLRGELEPVSYDFPPDGANDGPGPDGHHVVTGECFACMVGVATGPESHGDHCARAAALRATTSGEGT